MRIDTTQHHHLTDNTEQDCCCENLLFFRERERREERETGAFSCSGLSLSFHTEDVELERPPKASSSPHSRLRNSVQPFFLSLTQPFQSHAGRRKTGVQESELGHTELAAVSSFTGLRRSRRRRRRKKREEDFAHRARMKKTARNVFQDFYGEGEKFFLLIFERQ